MMTDALKSVGNCPSTAPGLKMWSAVVLLTIVSVTLSSAGCTASASAPPMPAHIAFSLDGSRVKSDASSLNVALTPVCLGVGGGPVGCPTAETSSIASGGANTCASIYTGQLQIITVAAAPSRVRR